MTQIFHPELYFHWWPLYSWSQTLINGFLWVLGLEVKVVTVKGLGSDPYPHPGPWSTCLPLAPTFILGPNLSLYLVPTYILFMIHSPIDPIIPLATTPTPGLPFTPGPIHTPQFHPIRGPYSFTLGHQYQLMCTCDCWGPWVKGDMDGGYVCWGSRVKGLRNWCLCWGKG